MRDPEVYEQGYAYDIYRGCPPIFIGNTKMKDPITWKVEGSNTRHSIPNKAVVSVEGKNGRVLVWVDEKGRVNIQDDRYADSNRGSSH